ncbi:16168_t:CDS:2 [Gigaspora rosea]|nr:16168_t:CDS:2 [Gigaspora rosea]
MESLKNKLNWLKQFFLEQLKSDRSIRRSILAKITIKDLKKEIKEIKHFVVNGVTYPRPLENLTVIDTDDVIVKQKIKNNDPDYGRFIEMCITET